MTPARGCSPSNRSSWTSRTDERPWRHWRPSRPCPTAASSGSGSGFSAPTRSSPPARRAPRKRPSRRCPESSRTIGRSRSGRRSSSSYFHSHARPPGRPLPDGGLARVSHRVRRHRDRHAAHDGAGGAALASDGARDLSRSRQALGQGDRHPVRGRRRVRDGALVRARAPVAPVHGVRRSDHRHAVLARGVRVLHRGDFPGHLPVRLGPHLAASAPLGWRGGGAERDGVGCLRRDRERLDECAGGVRAGERAGGERRSVRGDGERCRGVTNAAHDARGVRRHRVRGRRDPRVPASQGSGQRVPSPGARDRADRGRAGRRAAADLGRYLRPPRRRAPARETRRRRSPVPHAGRRAAHARRLARRRGARDPVRGRSPVRAVAARVPRSARRREGAGPGPGVGMAERPGRAPLVPGDGRRGLVPGGRGALDRVARVAAGGLGAQPLAPAGDRARDPAGLRGRRGRLDGDRAGSAAVGDLRRSEDPGRRHPDAGAGRAVRQLHAALLLPGRDRRLAVVPAYHPQSGGTGMARVLYAGRREAGCGRRGVSLADLLAGVIFVALNAYVVLGGADFGGGVWDLFALGPRRERQRDLIAEAIGPVWEANHVWLILAIVLLFTCFPPAFARLGTLLHIPLSLVLIGIVLRGSAFTFWRYGADEEQRYWGVVFAIASLITPLLLGTTAGAIASGALGQGGAATGDGFYTIYVAPWLDPFPLSVGLFALIAFAFLAAVYLTLEAREPELREDFRRRGLASGVGLFVAAVMALLLSLSGAPRVRDGLIFATWALPLHLLTAAAAITALWALWVRRWRVARVAAVAQVSLILWGWALSQYPYILPPDLSIASAAAPAPTLRLVSGALALGAVVLLPSLYYLLRVFKSSVSVT